MSLNLSVEYQKLYDVGTKLDREIDELENSLKKLGKLFNSVSECWFGPDSYEFIFKTINFVDSRKDEVNELRRISSLICSSSKKYNNNDNGWKNLITKEGLNDEQP